MPHPRKNLKLTGDTHAPEVEDELALDLEDRAAAPAAVRAAEEPAAAEAPPPRRRRSLELSTPTGGYLDAARGQVRARPLTAAAAAFFAGFLLAVVTRSR